MNLANIMLLLSIRAGDQGKKTEITIRSSLNYL